MNYATKGSWNFHNQTQVFFGLRIPEDLPLHLDKKPTLLVTSPGFVKRGLAGEVAKVLSLAGIDHQVLGIATANPSFEDLKSVNQVLAGYKAEQILGIGGGSVLDLAKVLSFTFATGAPGTLQLVELLKMGAPLPNVVPLPFVAVPTTSGTGSEVTPFATVWDMQEKKKHSLAAPNLFPTRALVDPRLTLTLPWDITLATGLDAVAQALESVWNRNYTPVTGALAARALRLGVEALPLLRHDLSDLEGRTKMAESSLLAGLCISRTRTAMSHSISYPLTAHFGMPHGIACAFTLPDLWDCNFAVDDGRMAQLLCELGFAKNFDFSSYLATWMHSLKFSEEFKKSKISWQQLEPLIGEMYTPGRASNNLCDFSSTKILHNFVKSALARWQS